jgi:hypothetical protein
MAPMAIRRAEKMLNRSKMRVEIFRLFMVWWFAVRFGRGCGVA